MMKNRIWIILLLFALIPSSISAQKGGKKPAAAAVGHEIVFNIPHAKDSIIYIAIYYRDKLLLKDSRTPPP